MNIDQLRDRFPNENACRTFFESIIWQKGRRCPHCGHDRSCKLQSAKSRPGLYECYHCKRQFTVTTKTPMHSTKLPLWKWLQAMLLYGQFKQGHILSYFGPMAGRLPAHCLENGARN